MTDRCPALIDLNASELGPEIEAHLAICRRCQALRATLPIQEGESAPYSMPSSTREIRRRPSVGDFGLVTTFDDSDNLVVFVASVRNGEAVVVPISDETRFATEWDLLLDENLLGYPAMAEAWNHGVVFVEQLSEALLSAPPDVGEQIRALVEATKSDQVPRELPVGAPVRSEDDPRLLFEEEEAENARRYWYPRMLLCDVATVGELVSRRQETLGLPDAALEQILGEAAALAALREDRLKLVEHRDAVADVLRTLRLRRYGRLRALLMASADESERRAHTHFGISFNRRRAGTAGAAELDREELRKHELEAFADWVISQLDE